MMGMSTRALVVACATVLLGTGCGKGAAEQALTAVSAAFDQAKPVIETYLPADFKPISDGLARTRAAFDKGDYKRALALAQALMPKIQDALEAAQKKKDELMASFTEFEKSLPAMVDSLKKRLAQLAAASALPADLDKETVETARANLDSVSKAWTDALSRFHSGDVIAAVAQANDVKTKLEEMARVFQPAPARK
jgi:hypothetical protein